MGARRRLFVAVALGVFLLDILMPPLVLSLARKPADFFTFNPWLKRLPDYFAAPQPPIVAKLWRFWDIALFRFSADGTFGVVWGFAVTTGDLVRFGRWPSSWPPISPSGATAGRARRAPLSSVAPERAAACSGRSGSPPARAR